LEPIALYHTRDLQRPGDGGWVAPYPAPSEWPACDAPIGSARVHGDGRDLTIVTFANGTYMSLRVARHLAEDGIDVRVVDLRWLVPLPVADILREAESTGRVLIVDETRRSGGVSEGIVGALVDANFEGTISRVTSRDSFVPLGKAADHVLLQEAEIEAAARALVGSGDHRRRSGADGSVAAGRVSKDFR
jgi:2-oxoisovalerate dehydrogenase E1 component